MNDNSLDIETESFDNFLKEEVQDLIKEGLISETDTALFLDEEPVNGDYLKDIELEIEQLLNSSACEDFFREGIYFIEELIKLKKEQKQPTSEDFIPTLEARAETIGMSYTGWVETWLYKFLEEDSTDGD
jgi:hypothetical protein